MSDLELTAVLIGRGTEGHDVITVAEHVLKAINSAQGKISLGDLKAIEGMGPAKASLFAASLEFARCRIRPEGLKVSFPPDVLPLIRHYGDRKQEHFICIS